MRVYQQALKEKDVTQSLSKRGNCLDNALMENWFVIMKTKSSMGRSLKALKHLRRNCGNISITTTMAGSSKNQKD